MKPADPARQLADEFFAGRPPTVPAELAEEVNARLVQLVGTLRGLRATGALYETLAGPPSAAREEAAKAFWAIIYTYTHANNPPPIRIPMPQAADRSTRLTLALTIACGPTLEKSEQQFLFPAAGPDGCRARTEDFGLSQPAGKSPALPANLEVTSKILRERMPDDWKMTEEAKDLATAFTNQMITEAEAAGRPPLIGNFVMKSPDYLPLLGAMDADHIRLIIRPTGIWCSFIFPDGEFAALWWSPRRIVNHSLPNRLRWAASVFLACLWRDATVIKGTEAFRVKAHGSRRGAEPGEPRQRVIVLPRTIRTMEWSDAEFGLYYDGQGREAHNVRAHYRRLPENWRASKEAFRLADRFGYPAPPDGYTFVRPYRVGDEDAPPPPRVVARGLQVAGVALAKL